MISHLVNLISCDLIKPKFNQYNNIAFGPDVIFVTFVNVELELSIEYQYNFIELTSLRNDIFIGRIWARYFSGNFKIINRRPNL